MPPAHSNLVDDALFLAGSYGLVGDPWQELVVAAWLGLRPDRKWSTSRAGLSVPRQNGKNGGLEIRELFGMVDLGERFLHTAHEVKTARKAFLRLLEFFDNPRFPELLGLVKEIRRTNGQEAIYLRNGGGIEFIARSKGSGRGFTVDVLVLDEAQELSDETYAALLPTISSAPLGNPQQLLTGTPPGPSVNGEVFTRTRASALDGSSTRLAWLEWSCDKDADLDDPAEWAAANPALGMRPNAIQMEAIVDERDAMDDETFARERLGIWEVGKTRAVIDMRHWSTLYDSSPPKTPQVGLALDITPDRSSASVSFAGRYPDDRRHVAVVDNQPGTGWIVPLIVARRRERPDAPVMLDASGPAGSLIEDLKREGIDEKHGLIVVSGQGMAQACGAFYDAVMGSPASEGRDPIPPSLTHYNQPSLNAALAAARKRPLGDAWAWHRKDATDISPLVSCTLALAALERATKKQRSGKVWGVN